MVASLHHSSSMIDCIYNKTELSSSCLSYEMLVMTMLAWFIMCQSLVASANNIELWGQALRGSPNKNSVTAKSAVSEASNVPSSILWGGVAIDYTGTHLYAAQNPGGLYMSSNRGDTWQLATMGIPTNENFFDVACSSSGQFVIASTSTAIYTSYNFGAMWIVTNIGSVTAVGSSGSGSLYAALKSTGVQISTDYGTYFVSIGSPSTGSPDDIAVSTNGTIIVASYRYQGVFTATLIGGTWTWSSSATLTSSNYDVPVTYGGGYFYASTGSTIYKSPDGITWTPTGSLPYWDGVGLTYLSAGDSDVIATNAQLFYSGNGGDSYVQKSGTGYFNVAVSGDNSNGVWISGSQLYYGDFADLTTYDPKKIIETIIIIIIVVSVVCGCCCIGGCVAVCIFATKSNIQNNNNNNSANDNHSAIEACSVPVAPVHVSTSNPVHPYSK